jgi:hypothetical protein
MTDIAKAYPIVNEDTWQRHHRTMLVIMVDDSPNYSYQERLLRFNSSLNRTDTIKADVFTLSDGNLYYAGNFYDKDKDPKLIFVGKRPGGRTHESLKEFATEKGYTQICYLESCI